ncbi:hypothetical protein HDV06_000595 [Boothiomyces sp. JEL0866]|nr:hypothetical protein HDV06_000595 [Boothiomyces sp. JEL0866]
MFRTIVRRSFYSFNLPKDTKALKLDDGSTLIYRIKESVKQEFDESKLPPRVHNYPKRDKLTAEQIKEIQRLRAEDPDTNTVLQLSKKYNTFPAFILKHTECPPERKQKLKLQETLTFETLSATRKKTLIDHLFPKTINASVRLGNGIMADAVSQTKNHWARDDPAFHILLVFAMCVAACAYGIVHYK